MNIIRRLLLFENGGLPRQNLLVYLRRPNSETAIWDEDTVWDENADWLYYALPISIYSDCDAETQVFFYSVDPETSEITPTPKTMTQILAWSEINLSPGYVFAADGKGVAVYSVEPAETDESKVRKYFKLT